MKSVNKVILIGNLGKDPVMRYAPSGSAVINFSVATSRSWKSGDDWKKETEWHAVTAFGPLAERLNDGGLVKGTPVYVEGRISTNRWTDKDGREHFDKNIIANEVNILAKAEKGAGSDLDELGEDTPTGGYSAYDDDIPF